MVALRDSVGITASFDLFAIYSQDEVVNKPVDKNPLSESRSTIRCSQFIERTEAGGDGRKKVAERLKDNPRRLGKGRVRLVGLAPLKPDRKVRERRQDSPVPLAAFARCQ